MHNLRANVLKGGVLVVAVLAVIGAWEVYKGTVTLTGQAQAQIIQGAVPGESDHFLCYRVLEAKAEEMPRQIELENQFGSTVVHVGTPEILCVPTTNLCDGSSNVMGSTCH